MRQLDEEKRKLKQRQNQLALQSCEDMFVTVKDFYENVLRAIQNEDERRRMPVIPCPLHATKQRLEEQINEIDEQIVKLNELLTGHVVYS